MVTYLHRILNKPIPQSEPLDDRQVLNHAGGYVFPVTDEVRMHRFLIMGTEDGSHYQRERELTLENIEATRRHIRKVGQQAVEHIVQVVDERRSPWVSPGLFCLAVAAADDDLDTRRAALQALPKVARTGSQLEEFASYVDSMRGWGDSLRDGVQQWYKERDAREVAFQAVKYRTRRGWSHRDLLRKAHPKVERESDLWHVFEWITQGTAPPEREPFRIIHAFLRAQQETDPDSLADLVTAEKLPHEAVPRTMLVHDQVWAALAREMPPLAFVRNLPALTSHNAIRPMEFQWAVDRIERMRTGSDGTPAPVHPMHLLLSMMVYRMGRSLDGNSQWSPVPQISQALDAAFDRSFSAAPETGKRIYLAVDVSGSMGQPVGRIRDFSAMMAAAAVSMAIARREPNHYIAAFSNHMQPFNVTARDSLWDVMKKTRKLDWGTTDLAQPMLDAAKRKIPVDCFVIATDGETWDGDIHPFRALQRYRDQMGIPAKAVQLAFVANEHSVMDPDDAGTLDLVGFDASMPKILHDFLVV